MNRVNSRNNFGRDDSTVITPKTSSIGPSISTEHRLLTDKQTQTDTDWHRVTASKDQLNTDLCERAEVERGRGELFQRLVTVQPATRKPLAELRQTACHLLHATPQLLRLHISQSRATSRRPRHSYALRQHDTARICCCPAPQTPTSVWQWQWWRLPQKKNSS